MKTLKQLWIESVTSVPNDRLHFSKWLEDCLQWTIKEWLKQKRQETAPIMSIGRLRNNFIDELLEELEK